MNEFVKIARKIGIPDLLNSNRNRENSTARQAIAYYLKSKGYNEKQIAKMQKRSRTTIIHQIKTFEGLLSVNDILSVEYWEKVNDL